MISDRAMVNALNLQVSARRVAAPAPPGSLLKRVQVQPRTRQEAAGRDVNYLAQIRGLPCLKCGMEPSEAAHVRFASAAFVRAMTRAVRRGREKAVPGTYVDDTPPIGHKRLYSIFPVSACGSPAAMCATSGGSHSGAETMK